MVRYIVLSVISYVLVEVFSAPWWAALLLVVGYGIVRQLEDQRAEIQELNSRLTPEDDAE